MKKIFLSAAIVLGGLTSFASTSPISNTIVKTISIQDDYTEIKLEEVPAAVTDALKKHIQMLCFLKHLKTQNLSISLK